MNPEEFDIAKMFRAAMENPLESLPDSVPAAEITHPKIEEPIDPDAGVWTKEQADVLLKKNSFPLTIFSEDIQTGNILPDTYNENNRIILFAHDKGVFLIPSSIQSRSLIRSGKYRKDESIDVPDLNNPENWTAEKKSPGSKFDQWQKLAGTVVDGSL